jgi:outer membrane immunogenic protein
MMRALGRVCAGLALACLAGEGWAADFELPTIPTPTYSWTGLYLGVHAGAGRASASGRTVDGFVGGAQLGFNLQVAEFLVLGVEADASGSTAQLHTTTVLPPGVIADAKIRNYALGSARGRIGIPLNRFLIYGTGGLGWAANVMSGTVAGVSLVDAKLHTGWTYGGGVEWRFAPDFAARAEFLHSNYGSQSFFTNRIPTGDIEANVVRVGVSYLR